MRSTIRSRARAGDFEDLAKATADLPAWYRQHGRRLGFRATSDPWAILVSEVMLQQTQVSRVEVAWRSFMAAFATPKDLSGAAPAAVLRAWAGLGYNRRAINLQRAARAICASHEGCVPSTVEELEGLPGIGPYTARAVGAIAFGVPVAAIDTNLRRVLGRVLAGHGWRGDPGVPLPSAALQRQADEGVERGSPAAWTHALMDIGATICRPVAPVCGACPLSAACRYAAAGAGAAAAASPGTAFAPSDRSSSAAARAAVPFPSTRRWLRGRIIDRLRWVDAGCWVRLDAPIGTHGTEAVALAIVALERDGLLERAPDGRVRLPSTAQ